MFFKSMRPIRRSFPLILGLAIFLSPLAQDKVYADTLSFSLQPPLLHTIIKPGKKITKTFKFHNVGDPSTFRTGITAFQPADQYGNIMLVDCAKTKLPSCQALPWIQISQGPSQSDVSFFKTDQVGDISVTLDIPPEASEGDYYLNLSMQSVPAPKGTNNLSQLVGQISSNIIITVSKDGTMTKEGSISDLSIQALPLTIGKKTIMLTDSFDMIPVRLIVTNTGKNVYQPKGQLSLNSPFLPEAHYSLQPVNILSGSSRMLTVSSPGGSKTSTSSLGTTSQFMTMILPRSFYLGLSTVRATLVFESLSGENSSQDKEGKQPEITAQVQFVALPFKLSVAVIIVIIAIAVAFLKKKNRHTTK